MTPITDIQDKQASVDDERSDRGEHTHVLTNQSVTHNTDPVFVRFSESGKGHLISFKEGVGEWMVKFDEVRDRSDITYLINEGYLHPEARAMSQFRFQWFGTVNYWSQSMRSNSPHAQSKRSAYLRFLLSKLRIELGLRGKDFDFFASEEFGAGGRPHHHFLVGFHKPLPKDLLPLEDHLRTLARTLHQEHDLPLVEDIVVDQISNLSGSVAYVCKKERHRSFKHFMFSSTLIPSSSSS